MVIHDIETNQIAAIYNPFSKRRVGDPSLLTQEEMETAEDCIGPYEKINWDGRKLKSMSSILRDEKGVAIGMLCINLDIAKLESIQISLTEFIRCIPLTPPQSPLFKDDWRERINQYVHTYLSAHHLSLSSLSRNEKKNLIEHLYTMGAFTGKNAAHYIAQIIGVSRATVYNYLSK